MHMLPPGAPEVCLAHDLRSELLVTGQLEVDGSRWVSALTMPHASTLGREAFFSLPRSYNGPGACGSEML